MKRFKYSKILLFILATTILSSFSFFTRNYIISNYNSFDFKIFTVDYVKNYGAAFSILHTHTSMLIVISIAILILTLYYILINLNKLTKLEFAFSSILTSGIICNLSERICDGYVTDYIRLNYITFPIFNVSDIFICIGAFILICNILFDNEQKPTKQDN